MMRHIVMIMLLTSGMLLVGCQWAMRRGSMESAGNAAIRSVLHTH